MLAGSTPELTLEEIQELQRQRDELLKRKREKEEILARLEPDDKESLRIQREALLATKKAKERELAQLMKKSDSLDKPPTDSKKDRYAPIPVCTEPGSMSAHSPQPHLQNNILEETKKQYSELKKEHKQDRQLLKDQKARSAQLARKTIQEINNLQLTVNVLLQHFGLETVPMDITDLDLEEDETNTTATEQPENNTFVTDTTTTTTTIDTHHQMEVEVGP